MEEQPAEEESADDEPEDDAPTDESSADDLPEEEEPSDKAPSDEAPDDDQPPGPEPEPSPEPEPNPEPSGELQLTVTHDLPGALPLPAVVDTIDLAYGQEVRVSLPESAEFDVISWFFNGERVAAETADRLVIGDRLAPGRHTLSVTAGQGEVRASKNVALRVTRSPAKRVVLGRNRGYLITERGDLYGWGSQDRGILLNGRATGEVAAPEFLMADVLDVAPAVFSTFVLTRDGTLYVSGQDPFGLFGLPSYDFHRSPEQIATDVVAVSASRSHALYIKESADGTRSLWGWGDAYGIAAESNTTSPVHIMDGIDRIAAGNHFSLAIDQDGTLYGWGRNQEHQLGTGTSNAVNSPRILASDAVSISAGDTAAAYIDSIGDLYTAGQKYRVPSAQSQSEWTHAMSDVREVHVGYLHSFLIDENDDLWVWGIDGAGALGTGGTDPVVTPVRVLRDVRSVGAGSTFQYGFSAAVGRDGTLSTWGVDENESLGNGPAGDSLVPLEVTW